MSEHNILCSISTRGRYDTTLPLAINSVIAQTYLPDHLTIYDDNDNPVDLREISTYSYLFSILQSKGISWSVIFGRRKGQHYNHQSANLSGYSWVWRLDDDTVAEPRTLETLASYINREVGAVGGAVLTPPYPSSVQATGKIENIQEPSIQWAPIQQPVEVDHLHCSFLYRAGVWDYNLALSRAAFREETLFTYGLKQRGYKVLAVPNATTWHLKNPAGGIREEQHELFQRDDRIFQCYMTYRNNTIVVLDCGMGDHVVFKKVLPKIQNPLVFSCYPELVPGRSIAEAKQLFGDIDCYNIYNKMKQWNWKDSLEKAFIKLYVYR